MTGRTLSRLAALFAATALLAGVLLPATGSGESIAERTLRPAGNANGASADPVLSYTGQLLVFDSQATDIANDPNGPIRDVFTVDRRTGVNTLVSVGVDGVGADGPSVQPTVSQHGGVVAFASLATNLVAGDNNGLPDVFVRTAGQPAVLVSVADDGTQANGPSSNPDISADGRYVVFQSSASNLVPDDTNGESDVFIRDVAEAKTALLSVARGGGPGNGASVAPAISADGNVVSFFSAANDLTSNDRNGVADVFARVRDDAKTEIVSVSSSGRAQDHSITAGFSQVSDVSRDGRYVVFDADASTLVHNDRNHRTDVFVRDRVRKRTEIVSENNPGFEGNNDSFGPVISPNGRFVAFQSLASNFSRDDAKGEDTFVRDRSLDTTSIADVGATGARKGAEATDQPLQRPALSSNGQVVAFVSTASNLVAEDTNGTQDVFLRLMTPPKGSAKLSRRSGRATVALSADDSQATSFVCQADTRVPYDCRRGSIRVPRGTSVFRVRAGGPGMLYEQRVIRLTVSRDRKAPSVSIAPLTRSGLRVVRGSARDRGGSGVRSVRVAVIYQVKRGSCRAFDGTRFVKASCKKRTFVPASGGSRWTLRLPSTVKGAVAVFARATDGAGNSSRISRRFAVIGR
jgi:Tol biopolymer transport system component